MIESSPLKHLASVRIVNGVGEAAEFDNPEWPRYVRTTDIASPRSLRTDTFKSLPPQIASRAPLEDGDIVMTAAGATIGKSLLYSSPKPACYAGYLVRFRPKHGVDSRFIAYWMESQHYWDQISTGKVVSTIENFSAGKYQNLRCPSPPSSAQRAIADYLDTETARIDALIEKKQRMIELLERRSAATLDDRLSGLFRPDVPLVPLRHVLREHDERAVGTETVLSVYRDYGVIVKASREDNFNKTPDDLSNYKTVRRGDVVVNKMKAWQGSLGVSSHDGIVSGDYLVCETTSAAVMHDYLHHLLRSPLLIGQYGVRSTGIRPSQWRLYWDDFASVRIPVPSASEQAELAGALEREYQLTRRLLDVVDGSIGLLREHRQALIIAAVTGELAVPGVAA